MSLRLIEVAHNIHRIKPKLYSEAPNTDEIYDRIIGEEYIVCGTESLCCVPQAHHRPNSSWKRPYMMTIR